MRKREKSEKGEKRINFLLILIIPVSYTHLPRKMRKKLIVTFLTITILLVALIGRIMYIEVTSGEKYEKIVLTQQEYDSTILPYQRGDIVDAKGTVLATSVDAVSYTHLMKKQWK